MQPLKVGVIGASGRMGQEILKVLTKNDGMIPYLGISRSGQNTGFRFSQKSILESEHGTSCDVWIDFSLPGAFSEVLIAARKYKKPLVSGTTGISRSQMNLLKELSSEAPVLWSANMSLGINMLIRLVKKLGPISHFDFQIEELHHNKKKDKPSGTAAMLQENLISVVGDKVPEPLSLRVGGVYGDHKIYAVSEGELICLEHRALNRSIFAEGAVKAAEWCAGQKPGLYSMQDVLNEDI